MSNKTSKSPLYKDNNLSKTMAFILNEILSSRNMSQRELARISGITQAQICSICAGKQSPSLNTIERIANALEIDVAELFSHTSVKHIKCPHCGKDIDIVVETKNNVKVIK